MTTRKQVRQAFMDLIQEGRDHTTDYPALTSVVTLSKKSNLPISGLPAEYPVVMVSLEQELLVQERGHNYLQHQVLVQSRGHNTPGFKARTAQVVVEVRAFGDDSEDRVEELADEIELLTDRKNTLPGDVVRQVQLEMVKVTQGTEEQASVSVAVMTFTANYQSEAENWEEFYEQ
ncbi:hypothetical protein [Pseudovibrio brasiliensis]|uniref:Uncharacterized protein n=1 Tax=Pseudovibrio brasiliensis TaxID=1898042 RepID=A0ABX8AVX7_9HYPH|nr:hypothetical protein [Pseudovibrio brasiliensis]QUS59204.1 hypothetical protein KGB56_26845 [Pseudovibrio brasiliensis]